MTVSTVIDNSDLGWLLLIPNSSDFDEAFSADVTADHSVGRSFFVDLDLVVKATSANPITADGIDIDCCEPWDTNDASLLILVEKIGDDPTEALGEYRIVQVHSPRDYFAAPGTRLREVLDLLEGSYDVIARLRIPGDFGFDHDTYAEYHRGIVAAERVAEAAGRQSRFPSSCSHGDEYLALEVRDLIGSDPEWTQEVYDHIAHPFARATGQLLHPDDVPASPQNVSR